MLETKTDSANGPHEFELYCPCSRCRAIRWAKRRALGWSLLVGIGLLVLASSLSLSENTLSVLTVSALVLPFIVYRIRKPRSKILFIPKTPGNAKTQEMTDGRADQIVRSYGYTMEKHAPAPGCVADSKKLPFKKNEIKAALLHVMRSCSDPKLIDALKAGYVCLADWQDSVGEDDQGLDIASLDTSRDTRELAKAVLSKTDEQEKWNQITFADRAVLMRELAEMGL